MSKSVLTPKKKAFEAAAPNGACQSLVGGVAGVIEDARRTAARSVEALRGGQETATLRLC